jgi:TonB family protein
MFQMRLWNLLAGVVLLAAGLSPESWVLERPADSGFREPRVAEAGEITYPATSVAYGFVTLDVTVDATGAVEEVRVVRDVTSLTAEAVRAVKNWRFEPAKNDGRSVRARTAVIVVFCPAVDNPPKARLSPALSETDEQKQDVPFSPPELREAAYPRYPVASVAAGTVVLELRVDADGKAAPGKVLRDIVSLTPEAVEAVKAWRFEPAILNGKTVPSNATAAFLFQRPPYPDTR